MNPLTNKSGPIWHCRVRRSACPDAKCYALQMDGPAPAEEIEWHTFDSEKLLLDPHAKAVYFPPGFVREAARQPGSNLGRAPLGLLSPGRCIDKYPSSSQIRHGSDLVLYDWNCGWEGNENVSPEVLSLRKQQARNFFCLLMLSNGTPMLRMGDELMHSQRGNNNPYNQDNETAWLDWARLEENRDLFDFVRIMIAFRKSHPTIARSQFWRDDIHWFGAQPLVDMSESSRTLAYFLPGLSDREEDLYSMINLSEDVVRFGVHLGSPGQWRFQIDTSRDASERPPSTLSSSDNVVTVTPRSIVVLTQSRLTTQSHPSQ